MPFAVTDDDTVFRLQFDPPLAGGDVGVRYNVTAEDGHVLSGSFSFTVSVDAPPPTTTTVAPATIPPATEAPSTAPPATEPVATEHPAAEPTSLPADATATSEPSADATAQLPATESTVGDADDSSNSGLVVAIAAVVAAVAAGFVLWRSRRSAET